MARRSAWLTLLRKVAERPAAFYDSCLAVLEQHDIYSPDDLAYVDAEMLAKELERTGVTIGLRMFLARAVTSAKSDCADGSPKPAVTNGNGMKAAPPNGKGMKVAPTNGKGMDVAIEEAIAVARGKPLSDHRLVALGPQGWRVWLTGGHAWDRRAFALHRALLGVAVLSEAIFYASHYNIWLSDSSYNSRTAYISMMSASGGYVDLLNLYMSCGGYAGLILLGIHAGIAWGLILGFNSRVYCGLALIFSASLHQRCGIIAYGGLRVMRAFLAWGMFRPNDFICAPAPDVSQGGCTNGKHSGGRSSWTARAWLQSMSGMVIIMQLCCIYVLTGLAKTDPEHWTRDGNALRWVMHLSCYARANPLVDWLKEQVSLCQFLTLLTLNCELYFCLLLFIPVPLVRVVVVFVFFGFHVSVWATSSVFDFSLLMVAGLAALLPTPAVDQLLLLCDPVCRRVHNKFGSVVRRLRSAAESLQPWQQRRQHLEHPESWLLHATCLVLLVSMMGLYVLGLLNNHSTMLQQIGVLKQPYAAPYSVMGVLQFTGMLHWWFMFAPRVTSDTWMQMYANTTSGTFYDIAADGLPGRFASTTLREAAVPRPRPQGHQRWLLWQENNFGKPNPTSGFMPVTEHYRPAFLHKMCAAQLPNGDKITSMAIFAYWYHTPEEEVIKGKNYPSDAYWYLWCSSKYAEEAVQLTTTLRELRDDPEVWEATRQGFPYKSWPSSLPWWSYFGLDAADWVESALWWPTAWLLLCLGATAVVDERDKLETEKSKLA
eukprot:TRINITY_DN62047_c0_g1_i1.p1 TRINITY_DN62047_c0_g1~~TRINITY_DN62047_c0_g1_i1.p1  ORF type:complete len:769 (+),score=111.86 TRINITY_DN62047_c0_g1_i1:139-2445(+)